MNQLKTIAILSILSACSSSGEEEEDDALDAEAQIEPIGSNTLFGEGDFGPDDDGVVAAEIEVEAGPPGDATVVLHAVGDCGNGGANAGELWNPTGDSEIADLGTLAVGSDGIGVLDLANPAWTLGDGGATDLMGKAVVIHDASGEMIACGVIEPDMD